MCVHVYSWCAYMCVQYLRHVYGFLEYVIWTDVVMRIYQKQCLLQWPTFKIEIQHPHEMFCLSESILSGNGMKLFLKNICWRERFSEDIVSLCSWPILNFWGLLLVPEVIIKWGKPKICETNCTRTGERTRGVKLRKHMDWVRGFLTGKTKVVHVSKGK